MAYLINDFYRQQIYESFVLEESAIARYIVLNSPNEDYSNLILNDNRYFIKYNFSDYRSSILRWYPFKENSSVLEIDAEYGAMTGALCDFCKDVTVTEKSILKAKLICKRYENRSNLYVYAGNLTDIKFTKKFDYIICFKSIETEKNPSLYLSFLKSLLNENGIIIIEVENQYGLQYLSGKKDSHTGVPFDSFTNNSDTSKGRGFNKSELKKILDQIESVSYKFYYPLPDYIAPRAIYTDECPPKANMIERLVISHEDSSTLIADDRKLYIDAVENEAYSFLSNHFIVEISNSRDNLTDIKNCTLSGYRSRLKAFATIIHDSYVEKKWMFPEGREYAEYLCSLILKLADRKIPVLPMTLGKLSLKMDYVCEKTVQQHINDLVKNKCSKQEFFFIFDKLWSDILASSEFSTKSSIDVSDGDIGPILKDGFLEMVSINSFWKDDSILYFDQEYLRKDIPAKYILFRSIGFVYAMIPGIEDIVSRKEVLLNYKISENLEKEFQRYESFLSNQENPSQIFFKNEINIETIQRNRYKLLEK